MLLKHASQVRLPSIGLIKDEATKKVFDQFMILIRDSLNNIYDDLLIQSNNIRHTISAEAITLSDGGVYVFTGSGAKAWTLPDLVRETEISYFIKNRGSATVTLTRAGTDEIWDTAAANTLAIAAGQSYLVTSDGTYWCVFDLN